MTTILRNTRYMQYLSAIIATLSMAGESMYSIWPSPSLPKLQSEDSPIGRPITDEEGSWIASSHLLGIVAGAGISGWLVEIFGRKKLLLLSGLLEFAPWFMIIFGKHIAWIYVARVVSGVGGGMIVIGCNIYNGEIAENDIRGKLGTSFIILKLLGGLLGLSIGPYVSYVWLAIISAILPVAFVVLFTFMPETPYYLVKSDYRIQAERNLRILSSKPVDDKFIGNRLLEIELSIAEDMKNNTTLWEFLSNRDYRKPIFVMTGIKILQQLCGLTAIEAYMQSIIELTESSISPEASSIIFGFVQIPAALTSGFLVDRVGRRPLLIISALGCAVALFGEGTYFYLQDVLDADVSSLSWLPTTALSLFLIMNPLGTLTLPYVLLGELFPANIKGIAVSITTVFGATLGFFVSKFFMPLSNLWGIYSMFWIFGSICIFGSIFVYVFLPETKGKSFLDIQAIMKNKKINTMEKQEHT